MQWISRRVLLACLLLIPSLTVAIEQSTDSASPSPTASTTAASTERIAKLEQQVTEAKSSADNAWMLVSAALVLMMTGPGLALFMAGLSAGKMCYLP